MDLEQLLHHHRLALLEAQASNAPSLRSRFDMVRHYRSRIERARKILGGTDPPEWLSISGF